jgi:lipoate-protein ligase A
MHQLIVTDLDTPDIFRHLAREAWLVDESTADQRLLYLWQAGPSVVIGRNQNPWQECVPARLAANGVALARRVSGGGSVYHDAGNLNFAFLSDAADFDRCRQLHLVADVLRERYGIAAAVETRHDLTVAGAKISGSAFRHRRHRRLHHGTLLVDADLDRLRCSLETAPTGIVSRTVASTPATVSRLVDHVPALTLAEVAAAIGDAFAIAVGGADQAPATEVFEAAAVAPIERHYRDWSWSFGQTPAFTVSWPPAAEVAAIWRVARGCVADVTLPADVPSAMASAHFGGARWQPADLRARLDTLPVRLPASVRSDMLQMLTAFPF